MTTQEVANLLNNAVQRELFRADPVRWACEAGPVDGLELFQVLTSMPNFKMTMKDMEAVEKLLAFMARNKVSVFEP